MSKSGSIGAVAAVSAACLVVGAGQGSGAQQPPTPVFVGAKACADCHARISQRWTNGRHSKMAQPATASSVKGDFSQGEIKLRGVRYQLIAAEGRYSIRERGAGGRDVEHNIDLTLGNRRIQHYLSKQDDGRIVVLAPTWDVTRREWFHNMEIVRPDEKVVNGVQVWNKNCDGCHVSQQQKNFDPAKGSYATTWQDFGTSCERCHGPGHAHGNRPDGIVNPKKLDPLHATTICAQCHSLRDVVVRGYTAGAEYYDHFMPILEYGPRYEADPAWWADGRPRRFSNDALGLWQSQCFAKGGATCTTCHTDPHEPDVDKNRRLEPANEALCTKCHAEIGRDAAAHTHHPPQSAGSSCVECHMPRAVFSIKAKIRDHSISLPAPVNTERFGIPNACGSCHADKGARWAERTLASWFPANRRAGFVRRAEAFTAGRARKAEAVAPLAAIASDQRLSPLLRANAVGYLSRYKDAAAQRAVLEALQSGEPLLRAVSALNLASAGLKPVDARAALVVALRDPRAVVRTSAAFSLVGLGVSRLDGEDGRRLETAIAAYVERARFHADDHDAQFDLGKFLLLAGRFDDARAAFVQSKRLEPARAVDYFLALADWGAGRGAEARARLTKLPESDPFAEPARQLLSKIGRN